MTYLSVFPVANLRTTGGNSANMSPVQQRSRGLLQNCTYTPPPHTHSARARTHTHTHTQSAPALTHLMTFHTHEQPHKHNERRETQEESNKKKSLQTESSFPNKPLHTLLYSTRPCAERRKGK